jgi:hypothetical protein
MKGNSEGSGVNWPVRASLSGKIMTPAPPFFLNSSRNAESDFFELTSEHSKS